MKITVRQLKQLIKEQVEEGYRDDTSPDPYTVYSVLKSMTSGALSKALGMPLAQFAKELKTYPAAKKRLLASVKERDYEAFVSYLDTALSGGDRDDGVFSTKEETIEYLKSKCGETQKDDGGW